MTPRLLPLLAIWAASASGGTLYLPAYPASVIVFDETKGQIVDHIPLATGAPRAIRLSQDRKKIYVTTIDHDGIEVIDIPTRKVVNHFVLDTPTVQYRFRGGAPEPGGKLFYTVTKEIDRLPEHFEVHDAKYTVIDLAQHKIVKTVEIAREDQYANEAGGPRAAFEFSADGKYLYQFGRSISIFRPADFRLLDRIELAHPDFPGVETLRFGGDLDPISEPGLHVSLFNAADPIVHNKVFGLARFDLGTKQVDFAPIGPAPSGMAGLQVTPDKKRAYTIVANGDHGNKRCEFWAFDLTTDHIAQKEEVPCRVRFSFGMSSDGKKLYIYGAGFEIEVYDAATLKYERTWDLNTDITPAGIVVLP